MMAEMAVLCDNPDGKVHGANMGPIWGRQDPGGPDVGPMSFAIWEVVAALSRNSSVFIWCYIYIYIYIHIYIYILHVIRRICSVS